MELEKEELQPIKILKLTLLKYLNIIPQSRAEPQNRGEAPAIRPLPAGPRMKGA